MKSSQDAFHFHMIYGTRHIKGVEVFKETEKHVIPFMHDRRALAQERRRLSQSGQPALLPPDMLYRETRYTRYRQRSLRISKLELQQKLQVARTLSYDDAWATTMQHSAVMKDDLREWLTEWKNQGLLEVTHLRPGQRFPRVSHGNYLKWMQGVTR